MRIFFYLNSTDVFKLCKTRVHCVETILFQMFFFVVDAVDVTPPRSA